MERAAIAEMCAAEDRHWWYAGLQDLLAGLTTSRRFPLPPRPAVLDVGCGTGANLSLLRRCLNPGYLGGFDVRSACVTAGRKKCPQADVYCSDLSDPELHCPSYDLVTCLDVVSDVGLDGAHRGLRTIMQRLTPRGRVILHVPACRWLYGEHDRAVGTIQRFKRGEVMDLMQELGLTVDLLTYRVCWLMPLIVAARSWRRLTGNPNAAATSDLERYGSIDSQVWNSLLRCENGLTCRGFRWPIGSSLIAVAHRPSE